MTARSNMPQTAAASRAKARRTRTVPAPMPQDHARAYQALLQRSIREAVANLSGTRSSGAGTRVRAFTPGRRAPAA